jgi:Uma2 family endonuclease
MYDPLRKYTVDEYWRVVESLPDRKYEYVDGEIRMLTGGSPAHAQIAARIAGLLDRALFDTDGNVYGSDAAIRLSQDRIYYPDVTVSCDPVDWSQKKALESPTVVVEVHSPSTEKTDRGEKLFAYQQYPTIQEILFVDSRKCLVEHHHRASVSKWELYSYREDSDVVVLTCIDVMLTVADIYHKVYLELEETT